MIVSIKHVSNDVNYPKQFLRICFLLLFGSFLFFSDFPSVLVLEFGAPNETGTHSIKNKRHIPCQRLYSDAELDIESDFGIKHDLRLKFDWMIDF